MLQEIKVDLSKRRGTIKALHGVNNGPVCYGELIDVSHHYTEAGIPLVRLHDPNWPYPREVDISAVFPDFSRDPEDPAGYDFSRTDTYIRSVLDTGAKIVYRLGQSIEHTKVKYDVHPPRDYGKWARICLGIIRHYNEGWADGFHYGIEYWEIWNEPDLGNMMWSGTAEQYYELYRVAATAIKARFPELKVGGYALSQPQSEFLPGFLAYCLEHTLPLDFFSWHTYTVEVERLTANAALMHERLVEYGFADVEVHLNEWNYADLNDWTQRLWARDSGKARRDTFEKAKGVQGASFCAAALIALQDARVDAANYYDGQPSALFCGLFDYYGVPQKTFYAFVAFNELVKHPYRVAVTVGGGTAAAQNVYACAGTNDSGQIALLISNPKEKPARCKVIVEGCKAGMSSTLSRLDADHDFQPAETVFMSLENDGAGAGSLEVEMPGYGVVLIRIG